MPRKAVEGLATVLLVGLMTLGGVAMAVGAIFVLTGGWVAAASGSLVVSSVLAGGIAGFIAGIALVSLF